ncbi:hypothetical protein EJB05_14378, partial [Eragrostis curvula]
MMHLSKPRRLRRQRRCRSQPQLMDDVVDEILLRLPTDDPACLFRASAVCRTWQRIVTDPGFSGRYRAFHRTPPLLGVLRNPYVSQSARFVPTTSFCPTLDSEGYTIVFDCRHGRVLLDLTASDDYAVWNPITGDQHRLPEIPGNPESPDNAAVLCAAEGCDHSGCAGAGGPFYVAVVGHGDDDGSAHACLYSSITGAWSAPTSIQTHEFVDTTLTVALVGDAAYFPFELGAGGNILQYDIVERSLSMINPTPWNGRGRAIMPTDDGGLRFASFNSEGYRLHLGKGKIGLDGDVEWEAPHRVIELKGVLPRCVGRMGPVLMGVADGAYAVFLANKDCDVFIIDLGSLKARKVCHREQSYCVFPYMSFYMPGTG